MAQWQVSLVDGLMDFSFSILIALFYASVLSARYGKTKFRVIVSAVMIIATIITDLLHTPQTTKFFLGIFILMGCIFILSDDKPLKKILFTFIPYISDILLSLTYLSLRTILLPNFDSAYGGQTLTGLSRIPNAVEPLLLFIVEMLVLFLISKWIQHKKPKMSDLTIIYILSIIIVQIFILTFLMHIYYAKVSILKFILVLILYMVISILLTVLVIRYSIRISKEQAKQEFVVNQYNLLSSQYDQLRNNYVNYKKLRHDLKDHINVINGLSQKADKEELTEYTSKLLKNWDSLSAKTYCDVPAIDIILAEKYNMATANHIRTDFLVGGIKEANLDNVYLCSIFSNLLNNALEASKYCTINPYIELKSSIQLGNLVITCRNSMPQVIRKKDDPNHNHGYGLHIIKDLSNLLGGNFVYEHDEHNFTAIVTIPINGKEEIHK